jgi:arabinofuranosyltransferase
MKTLFRLAYPVVLTVLACWLVSDIHGHPTRGIDDAQILFSYSSNLAHGRGLVYANNPQHVEGATSLLWTLICSIPFGLGLDEPGVLAISVLLLCLTQVLALLIIRKSSAARQAPSWPFELAYLLAVFSSPAYFAWMSITLMDTCLWGFLVVLMTYVALSPPRSGLGIAVASIPFFLAPLSRPEAALVAPAIIGLAWLHNRSSRRLVLSSTVAFLVSVVAVTVFRLSYFGYPFPNTFYAKVSPSLAYNLTKGGEYLLGFALTSGPIVVASTFFLLWCAGDLIGRLLRYLRTRAPGAPRDGIASWRLTALSAMVLLVVPVLTGGDRFPAYRFYQPAYPVMVLAVVLFLVARLPTGILGRLATARLPKPGLAFAVLLAGLAYWAYSDASKPSWMDAENNNRELVRNDLSITEDGMQQGRLLRALFSGSSGYPTVAVIGAGGIARTYPGRIVDLMGLNTPEISHYRGDRKGERNHAGFEKEPFFRLPGVDVLIAVPPVPPITRNFATIVLKGLLDDPRFVSKWRYGTLHLSGDEAGGFKAFYTSRLIDSLEATGRYQFRAAMKWSGKWVVDSTNSIDSHRGGGQ